VKTSTIVWLVLGYLVLKNMGQQQQDAAKRRVMVRPAPAPARPPAHAAAPHK
jgi:hypothetical protein